MLLAVAGCALLSLIGSPYPDLAPLQNLPTLLVVAFAWWLLRRRPLDSRAVACVCAFLLLHTLGGRYAYSYVPYDRWLAGAGLPTFADAFGMTRNGYDRVVHFSFGALMAYPLAHALRRHGGLSPRLATYIAIEFIFAASAAYEIFEWLLTLAMAGPRAAAYNGQQGDIWDAQKDMACAASGAILWWLAVLCRDARRSRRT